MTLDGLLSQQPFAIGGSGSSYIYGFVDAEYRKGMTRKECQKFVVEGTIFYKPVHHYRTEKQKYAV